jgi:6-pyruvoyltetrahydropterin/6-carboxytetrahydropterin synthase
MEIYREFTFDAAHFLPHLPEGHKCREMHGHTYRIRVYLKGKPVAAAGWIIDFKEMKNKISVVIDEVDHKTLNHVPGLENPTAENITLWFWQKLKGLFPNLSRIELKETASTGVMYAGEDDPF